MRRILIIFLFLGLATTLHASTLLLTGATFLAPLTGSNGATYNITTPTVYLYTTTPSLVPNTWTQLPGTSNIVTYSSAEETASGGSSLQYYTAVVYGTATTDANGFPTGLSAISGSTNVKYGYPESISGNGFVASAYFSPTTGSYQYYTRCNLWTAAASNVYVTFIISNGTWTWVQYYETYVSSATGIEAGGIGPKTYWTSGNYVYVCAAYAPGGLTKVGDIQISSGTLTEGTSYMPSSTWYPLSPAPTNLDTQPWYSQRDTTAQDLKIGTAYLIAFSGGSDYYVANPSLTSSVTLALINLGASPTVLINGTRISLETTYYYNGPLPNLNLTIISPNGNTIYTINKFYISGTMNLEIIGANNPNYYVGPAALPRGTWLSQATINPTALTPNVFYNPYGGVPHFSFSITVNGLSLIHISEPTRPY